MKTVNRPSLHGLTVQPSRPACRRQAASAAWAIWPVRAPGPTAVAGSRPSQRPVGLRGRLAQQPCSRCWRPVRPTARRPARLAWPSNEPISPAPLQYKRVAVRVFNPNRCLPTVEAEPLSRRRRRPFRRRIPPPPRRPQPSNFLQAVDPPSPFLIHHRSQTSGADRRSGCATGPRRAACGQAWPPAPPAWPAGFPPPPRPPAAAGVQAPAQIEGEEPLPAPDAQVAARLGRHRHLPVRHQG
jgi:hypothetical protein